MGRITIAPLTLLTAAYLSQHIREQDRKDVLAPGGVAEALTYALVAPGEAYTILDCEVPIGGGGWTEEGQIWSLWVDLTLSQSVRLRRLIPWWLRLISARANRRLINYVRQDNTWVRKWLEKLGAFTLLDDQLISWQGHSYTLFELKPLEDLPRV